MRKTLSSNNILQKVKQNSQRLIIISLTIIIAFMLYESTILFIEFETAKHCFGIVLGIIEQEEITISDDESDKAFELAFCTIIIKAMIGDSNE